jgi:hypothetical protein
VVGFSCSVGIVTTPIWPIGAKYAPWIIRALAAGWAIYDGFFTGGEDEHETTETMPHWHKAVITWTRTQPSGLAEDKIQVGFDLLRNDISGPTDTWVTADFTAAEARFLTWLTSVNGYVPNYVVKDSIRWYRRHFNPLTETKPFAHSGPPVRVLSVSAAAGGGGGTGPPQLAMSVTERTALPRHWGRFYLPTDPAAITASTNGRFSSSAMTAIGNATDTLYEGLHTDHFNVCVPCTQLDKQPVRALLGVTQLAVDDIPDVIRRRRWDTVGARNVHV